MIYVIFLLSFALAAVLAWAIRNQWLVKCMLADQKRVMEAHGVELLNLFEQQVVDAVRALLWQASGEKFNLQTRSAHNYVVMRGRKQVIRLCFHSNLTVLCAVEWKNAGQQQVFTFQEMMTGLYNVVISQVGQYSAYDAQYGGAGTYIRHPSALNLANLSLVHTNGK